MPVTGAFPYELNNILGGAARVLWAPITAAVPTGPKDIFSQVFPYNPQGGAYTTIDVAASGTSITVNDASTLPASGSLFVTTQTGAITLASKAANVLTVSGVTAAIPAGSYIHTAAAWRDFGATRDAFSYNRDLAVGQFNIQQTQAAVLEEVTEFTRTARVSIAEIGPDNLVILEEGTRADVTAASGTSAFEGVQYGTIENLTQRRVAFVARKAQALGVVVEPTTLRNRGRFVVGLGYRGQLSADNVELGFARGELSAAQVTFKFYPESSGGFTSGTEYGVHWIEKAGTIA